MAVHLCQAPVMSDRVACANCGKWMFHLAKTCPHCGTPQANTPGKKLELSSEEARSLLTAAAPPGEPRMKDVAAALVLPRGGGLELALSIVAFPVTLLTLVVLGYGVLQTMRKRHAVNLRGARMLAVPTAAAFAAVVLFQNDAPIAAWIALATSLSAWLVRDLIRASVRPDPMS